MVLDNLPAHKAREARDLVEQCGASWQFLPPYSHELNPIEAGWGVLKKRKEAYSLAAPRTGRGLRRTAHKGRRAVRPRHCQNWYALIDRNSSDLWG